MRKNEAYLSFPHNPSLGDEQGLKSRISVAFFTPSSELKDSENVCLIGVVGEEWRSVCLGVEVQGSLS